LDNLIKAIILGIIQGLSEWLPISSTGHLRLTEYYLGLSLPILFDVTLHIGTLFVVFVFFRKDIKNVLTSLAHLDFKTENGKLIPLIIIALIPTAILGIFFSFIIPIETLAQTPLPIAAALIITGTILYTTKKAPEKTDAITTKTALAIGTAQGIALIPGISRSGTTIAIALLIGLKREKAFTFSFLLSIPAVIGALGLTLYQERHELAVSAFTTPQILIGTIIAAVTGYIAIRILQRALMDRKFHLFAVYCWGIGVVVAVLAIFGI
jgi:undecaprenyl-diphosphatase